MAAAVTRDSHVIGVKPDLSLATFTQILTDANSPAAPDATGIYNAVLTEGVSPAFFLSFFRHESNFGELGVCHDYATFSPGNTRTSRVGVKTFVLVPGKGTYVQYQDWIQGTQDACRRLTDPAFDYAKQGAKTIAQILPVWAPASDSNNPVIYIQSVVDSMNQWIAKESEVVVPTMQDPTNKIDIVHPNKGRDGANPEIIVLHVQEGTNYLPDFFRQSGDDSTMWCMQDGTLIRMEQDSDSAWTNGLMTEPLDHSNPHIQSLINRGITNSNIYALTIEHQGFASGQFTDAAIEATAKMCAYWMTKYGWSDVDTRIVSHAAIGQHKNCPGPNFPWSKLKARVKDLIGVSITLTTDNHTTPATTQAPGTLNGHVLAHGFLDYFNKYGGVKFFGLPLSEEQTNPQTGLTEQVFERYVLEYDKNEPNPDWQVRGKNIGVDYLSKRGF